MRKNLLTAAFLTFAGIAFGQTSDGVNHTRVPVKIVAVGNSITDGYGSSSRETSWPGFLDKFLGSDYTILNYGVSGTTMSREADASYWNTGSYTAAKNAKPEILILALGTNDADPWRWNLYGKDFETDFRAMIKAFRDAGANPVLYFCLAPPKFPLTSDQNKVIEGQLIPKVKKLATEYHAFLIDYHTLLLNRADLYPDDIHPNDEGAEFMANFAKGVFEETQTLTLGIETTDGSVVDERVALVNSGSDVTVTPSATDGTWLWNGPGNFTSEERVLSLTNVTSGGVYTVRQTDENGYVRISKMVVSVNGKKASTITSHVKADNASNWSEAASLTVRPGTGFRLGPQYAGGNDNVTWSWTGPNGFQSNNREIYIPVAYDAVAGTYTVTVTDAQGRQNSRDVNVTVRGANLCPNVVVRADLNGWKEVSEVTLSGGGSVKLGPLPMQGGQWVWTGPNGFTISGHMPIIKNFNKSMEGVYTGTYTNEAGCEEEVQLTINFSCPEIIPYINYNGWKNVDEVTVPSGTTITFGPHPNVNEGWSWKYPNGRTYQGRERTVTITQSNAGTYTATYKDSYGCVVEKEFIIKLQDSAVENVEADKAQQKDKWHDLQGRPVNKDNIPEGIYLHNDKKVVK